MFGFIQPNHITFYLTSILLTFALGMEGCRDKVTGGLGMPEFLKSKAKKDDEFYDSVIIRIKDLTERKMSDNLTKEYVLENKEKFNNTLDNAETNYRSIWSIVRNDGGSTNYALEVQECFKLIMKQLDWSNIDTVTPVVNSFINMLNIYNGRKLYQFKNPYINRYFANIKPYIKFCDLAQNQDKIEDMFSDGLSNIVNPIKNRLPILNSLDDRAFMENFELYAKLSTLPPNLFEEPSVVTDLNDLDNIKKIIKQSNYLKAKKELYNKYSDDLLIQSFHIKRSLGTDVDTALFLENPDLFYKLRDLKMEYDKYNRRRPFEPKASDIDTIEKVQYHINSLNTSIENEKGIERLRFERSRFK
jgi:hypothetical protein